MLRESMDRQAARVYACLDETTSLESFPVLSSDYYVSFFSQLILMTLIINMLSVFPLALLLFLVLLLPLLLIFLLLLLSPPSSSSF